jgi:AcrR family transcriptional regulator
MKRRVQGQRANLDTSDLFSVTIRLIAEHGYFDVSFQKIADAMGVSQSTILHYYPNRIEMMRSLFGGIVLSNHKYVAATSDPKDRAMPRLRKHFLGNFNWAMEHPEMASLVGLLYYQASFDINFSEIYAEVLKVGRSRIYEYLLMASREGELNTEMNLIIVSEVIHESLIGLCINGASQLKLGMSKVILQRQARLKIDLIFSLLRT